MFEHDSIYTREEINARVGGQTQWYLPTKNGRVVAGCFDPKKNPGAPAVILPGTGPQIEGTADLLVEQRDPIPVFLKEGTKQWRYVGDFRAVHCSQDPEEIRQHAASLPNANEITRVLFLEQV